MRSIVTLALLLLAVGEVLAQDLIRTFSDQISCRKAAFDFAGDVDQDGYDDVVAVLPQFGRVYSGRTGETLLNLAGFPYPTAASSAGDVNGDGFPDFILGYWGENGDGLPPCWSLYDVGAARVFSGRDSSLLYSYVGCENWTHLGESVGGGGDIDGDGFADFLMGAPGGHGDKGQVLVASGRDGSILYDLVGPREYSYFGQSVSDLGDVDDDGYDDFIVGGYGRAWVYSGGDGTLLHDLTADYPSSYGETVNGAGDVNGDGLPDFVVSHGRASYTEPHAGAAWVYSGPDASVLHVFYGETEDQEFGVSIDGAGDVNGDGFNDIVVGAPGGGIYWRDTPGAVFVYSGLSGNLLYPFTGTLETHDFGYCVRGGGDLNRDGFSDILFRATQCGESPIDVHAHGGNDLYLMTSPGSVSAGDDLSFVTIEATPGSSGLIAIVDVNGLETFLPVLRGSFGADSTWEVRVTVPPGIGSLSVSFQSLFFDGSGLPIFSGRATVEFQ